MYKNPDFATKLTPPLANLAKYITSANADGQGRDVRQLMSWLMQIGQIDLHFMGLVQTRKLALTGFTSRIDMLEGLTPKDTDKKRMDEMRARYAKSKISSLIPKVINGYIFGQNATRLIWENDSLLGTRVKTVQCYDLSELDIDKTVIGGLLHIDTNVKTGTFTSQPLDPEIHLIVRANPLDGVDENFIGSLARVSMIYAWLKYDDVFHWARSNEKFGDPLLWASFIKGTDPKEVDAIVEGLDQMASHSRAAFSDDVKLQLLETARTTFADMHTKFIGLIEDKQAILILGQAMTTDSKVGANYAKSLAGNFVREDYLYGDIIFCQNIFTEQYLAQDFKNNYSTTEPCPYVFRFNTDEVQDTEANARKIQTALDSNIPLRQDEVYRQIGFTPPGPDDVIFGAIPTPPTIPPTLP